MSAAKAVANTTFEAVKSYAKEHPYLTALYAVNGVVLTAPALAFGPALAVAGFGVAGPVAGGAAAAAQGSSIAAGSLFATAQSAAMGGYGVAALSGITQGASVVSTAFGAWFGTGKKTSGSQDSNDGASEENVSDEEDAGVETAEKELLTSKL